MPQINDETLNHVFSYHQPKGDQTTRYFEVRNAARAFAAEILRRCPESPERTLALRDVQRAVMMANAAIALNE
jgi:hypothetical protein